MTAPPVDLTVHRVDPAIFEGWAQPPPAPPRLRRLLAAMRPVRRVGSSVEHAIVASVQAAIEFPLLVPRSVPRGYRLAASDMVPGCTQLATLVFRGPATRSFRLTQRLSTFSVAQELASAGEPHVVVRSRGRDYTVIGGAWVGEPCYWNWQTGRRVTAWEQEGRICELEQVTDRSPPVEQTLRVAASMRLWLHD